MASNAVRQSIINRVQALIISQGWDAVYIDIENQRANPPKGGGDWLAVQFTGSEETQITTGAPGNNTFRETGDFLIFYVTASATGSAEVFNRLETTRSNFRFTLVDGVKIDGVNPPDSNNGLDNTRGNWWAASILTSYEFDIRG